MKLTNKSSEHWTKVLELWTHCRWICLEETLCLIEWTIIICLAFLNLHEGVLLRYEEMSRFCNNFKAGSINMF